MPIIHHTSCPGCDSRNIREIFDVKDHTVSGYLFPVWECADCLLRFTQNIPDENSIGEFYRSEEYISHTDNAPGLVNKIYRIVRKRTLKGKRRLVEAVTALKNGDLLDIGSGTGAFVNEMIKNGWKVTGLEPDPGARSVAEQNYQVRLEHSDRLKELEEGRFDAITLWHVLEHVHELHPYMSILKKLLRKEGKLFIAVPNYTSQDAVIYKNNWAGYDVPRHLYHFSPLSMKKLLEKHGLKLIGEKPMWYDSFYLSILSNKQKNGRSDLSLAFLNGLRSNFRAWGNVEKCSSVIYIVGK